MGRERNGHKGEWEGEAGDQPRQHGITAPPGEGGGGGGPCLRLQGARGRARHAHGLFTRWSWEPREAGAQGRQRGDYKGIERMGAGVGSSLTELSSEGRERVGVVEVRKQLPVFLLCPLPPCLSPPALPMKTAGKRVATVATVKESH